MNSEDIQNSDQQRKCAHCDNTFEPSTKTHRYCSVNCRVAHLRQQRSTTAKEQEQVVQDQADEISDLKAAPVTRTESVRIINLDWQLAKQAREEQADVCEDKEERIAILQQEVNRLINPVGGGYKGVGIGVGFVAILASRRFDDRENNPLGTSFWVIAVFALIVMGVVGFWVGRFIEVSVVAGDKQGSEGLTKELTDKSNSLRVLRAELEVDMAKLEELKKTLSQVPKYHMETETTIDESRGVV